MQQITQLEVTGKVVATREYMQGGEVAANLICLKVPVPTPEGEEQKFVEHNIEVPTAGGFIPYGANVSISINVQEPENA